MNAFVIRESRSFGALTTDQRWGQIETFDPIHD
ncbi:MAG: hypothetical protein JWQ90_2939 [Hydrocarboniphaga sp.]|nr:hypothetical protein [Hydrocarboniphaga sp.]